MTALSRDPLAFHAVFRPQAEALVDLAAGLSLNYRDLNARVSASAAEIAKRIGRNSGERIAVIARNSADKAILAMGCERAGAIFVPLNWRLTPSEIAQLISDCAPAIVCTDDEFRKAAPKTIPVSDLAPDSGEAFVAGDHDPDAPAIILYTSGTTGKPKGVIITRGNALWSSLNFSAVAQVNATSRLLCDAPMFHTVGLIAVTRTALQQGGCAILSDRFVPSSTLQRLSDPKLGVTHYFVVPQMIEALLREPASADADFSRLVALFSGGGPLSQGLVSRFAERGVKLVNGFGMSEIGSGIHMPLDAAFIAANPGACGFPAPHLDVKLADANGADVAGGEVGEIWMRGPSVSPGYWRQEDATRASRSGHWFRSGDLASRDANGVYRLIDRRKDMYISGGENVYPAEVEATIRQAPGVTDVAVVGVPDPRWGETGAAFIESTGASEDSIRTWCAGRLARFKQPAHIRFVAQLPRTGSGKVRKDLLRAQFAAEAQHAH